MQPPGIMPLPRPAWIALLLVLAWSFGHFWIQTMPVRVATGDDVRFQKIATQGTGEAYTTDIAGNEGRFIYGTPVYRFVLFSLYEVGNPWVFSLLRAIAFYVQVGLAAWLAARVTQSTAFGALLALLIVGTLHIPDTFFQLLSFPPIWLGFAALLGALHAHLSYLHRRQWASGLLAGVLYLLALLMHDVFVVFLPLFLALGWLRERPRWRDLPRQHLIPLAVAVAYVAVHRGFAREFPSAYEGTQFSLNFPVAAKVLLRQLIGVTPGFELLVQRLPEMTAGPLFREPAAVVQTIRALPWPHWLLALVTAGTSALMFWHCRRTPALRTGLWPWALGFAGLANLPIAFSVKYQVFILHREYPYGYAYLSFYFLCVAAIGALVWLGRHLPPGIPSRVLAAAFGGGVFALGVSALASNQRILQILVEKYT